MLFEKIKMSHKTKKKGQSNVKNTTKNRAKKEQKWNIKAKETRKMVGTTKQKTQS